MYFSTVEMDSCERSRVIRQYRKSSLPRLRWTPDLHDHFVESVRTLGGKHSKFLPELDKDKLSDGLLKETRVFMCLAEATPKKIMQTMKVKGVKISQIKSHLQMYRSMTEITTANEFLTMENYQENRPNLRQNCEEGREAPPHGKLVRVTQKGSNVIYHDHQGSSTCGITRGSAEEREANTETRPTHEINFLGLDSHQMSESNELKPINLELTISSY